MASCAGVPAFTRFVTAVWRVLWKTYPPCFRPSGNPARLQAVSQARLKSPTQPYSLRWLDPGRASWTVEDVATVKPALSVPGLDDFERPAVERQHVGLLGLGVPRIPAEHPRLAVQVRPRGARELLLAGSAEVRELEEVLEVLGQLRMNCREGVRCQVAAPGAILGKEEVGEVEPRGIEAHLAESVRAAQDRQPPIDGGGRQPSCRQVCMNCWRRPVVTSSARRAPRASFTPPRGPSRSGASGAHASRSGAPRCRAARAPSGDHARGRCTCPHRSRLAACEVLSVPPS